MSASGTPASSSTGSRSADEAGGALSPLVEALTVTAVFAVAAYQFRAVGRGGAIGGLFVGTVIYASLGWRGFAVLALFVAGGSALTRLGYDEKRRRGRAEARSGRRGAANALANCGVALLCALGAALASTEVLVAAFVSALGAAFADTAESEIGQLYRGSPRLITNLKKVPPGTDGAVSAPGTLAGLAAAGVTSLSALLLGLVGGGAAAVVFAAAFLGTLADSLVGALAPRLGNELTNVICTLFAAATTISVLAV